MCYSIKSTKTLLLIYLEHINIWNLQKMFDFNQAQQIDRVTEREENKASFNLTLYNRVA